MSIQPHGEHVRTFWGLQQSQPSVHRGDKPKKTFKSEWNGAKSCSLYRTKVFRGVRVASKQNRASERRSVCAQFEVNFPPNNQFLSKTQLNLSLCGGCATLEKLKRCAVA